MSTSNGKVRRENSEMVDEYRERIGKHHRAVAKSEHELFQMAQRLCPGDWVFHVIASTEYQGMDDSGARIDDPVYYAIVTNGDDNVTAEGKNVAAAVALLVHYLLDGSVFPLTGDNGGRFNLSHWERKIEEAENRARQEARLVVQARDLGDVQVVDAVQHGPQVALEDGEGGNAGSYCQLYRAAGTDCRRVARV